MFSSASDATQRFRANRPAMGALLTGDPRDVAEQIGATARPRDHGLAPTNHPAPSSSAAGQGGRKASVFLLKSSTARS